MNTLLRCAALGMLFGLMSARASAQSALFFDDFENGPAQWTLEAEWHLTPNNLSIFCVPHFYVPSGATMARFGTPAACQFGAQPGRMTTAAPIAIPADAQAARLRFWSWEQTECGVGNCGWDHRTLYVSDDGGASWDVVYEGEDEKQWYQKLIDLSGYIGSSILVAFEFDPIDEVQNFHPGWFVDDVQVEIDATGGPSIYCTPKKNSAGCYPYMAYAGDGSLSGADDLVLSCTNLRNNVWGSFAWSLASNSVPFNGGTLCVQIPAIRTTVISTGGGTTILNCSGSYSWFFSHDYLLGKALQPGQTLYCQYFGRDVASGAPMTLSNAVAVPLVP
jgi:hypothetical protein